MKKIIKISSKNKSKYRHYQVCLREKFKKTTVSTINLCDARKTNQTQNNSARLKRYENRQRKEQIDDILKTHEIEDIIAVSEEVSSAGEGSLTKIESSISYKKEYETLLIKYNQLEVKVWEQLTAEFNSASGHLPRTTKSLKIKYDSIKKDLRKKKAANRQQIFITGGGTSDLTPLTTWEEKLLEIILLSCEGLPATNDCDTGKMILKIE
ncbi:hypothetical protein RN001_001868 [Aquatica leii]|uniref:Regulatory protein zeste n=1 Tax=Aquatica leii TaxID=1421715 RepID=A0AAN7PGG3_9COLE|nr:hypothetical protein RN001_001868 [Aquatica leii]